MSNCDAARRVLFVSFAVIVWVFGWQLKGLADDHIPAYAAVPAFKPTFQLRGRFETDALAPVQSDANRETYGDLPAQAGPRRARIGGQGEIFPDTRYVAEIDLASGQVVLRDLYLGVGDSQDRREYKFGHMREPFSLEGATSSNTFAFLERSSINTLDPARNWGVGFTEYGSDEMWTLAGGIFQAGTDSSDLQFGLDSTTAFTLRGTRLAWYEDDGRKLMHFGFAISERIADQGVINFRQQPTSSLLTFGDSSDSPFQPKISIPANFQQLINLQWAYADGPFWSQAEWYGSVVAQVGGDPVFFHGSHLDVGYFLTGEHRHYLTKTGVIGQIDVKRPFVSGFSSKPHSEPLGYGAWEVASRISYQDFIDGATPANEQGQIPGVMLPQLTVGVNWYLADQLRVMFNYVYSSPQTVDSGMSSISLFGVRVAVFW